MKDLISELKKIKAEAMADNYDEALRSLDVLTETFPMETELWCTRAYVNGRQGNREAAVDAWSKAIELCDKEPHYYLGRGANYFRLKQFESAIADFTRVIELCDFYNSDYYREAAYLFRADAHLRLGQSDKAKADCMHVHSGRPTMTDKLRTKADILAECA